MLKPKLPSLFKMPRHSTFEYKPRYYDAEKESRAERNRLLQQEISGHAEGSSTSRDRIRAAFERHARTRRNATSWQARMRLISIFIILVLITYLLLS